ncbi:MAG: DeoR/GlpR transcriptional regulator [Chloroflexi bacterium]|nr:DeoR/GlpR transcriptional regulator [Chloroflexota bacterium]
MTAAVLATAERRQRILGLAQARGQVLVTDLSDAFGVSEVTIRGDLTSLARRGLLIRTHGGALLPERAPVELAFATREVSNVELKRRIGLAAADLVLDGQSVVLDASTTALQLAGALRSQAGRHDVTVITNGVQTALALLDAPGISTILTGGQLRATAVSLTGALASDLLGRVHAAVGFFGAIGLTVSHGLTDVNLQEIEMKAAMAAVCERVVALVDHTKLGQVGLATFAPVAMLSLVITDQAADPEQVATLRAAGVEVCLV